MPQVFWIFLSQDGDKYKIGLYHGETTGHLLLHCNQKVIQIDFGVNTEKSYTFFIKDELCEINLTRTNNHFRYAFNVNNSLQTPLNQARKKQRLSHRLYLLILTAALLTLLITLLVLQRKDQPGALTDPNEPIIHSRQPD